MALPCIVGTVASVGYESRAREKKKKKEGLPVLHTMPQSIAKGCVHSPGEWTTEPTNEQPEKRIKCHLHQVITASW
jgi:hypothetical protein